MNFSYDFFNTVKTDQIEDIIRNNYDHLPISYVYDDIKHALLYLQSLPYVHRLLLDMSGYNLNRRGIKCYCGKIKNEIDLKCAIKKYDGCIPKDEIIRIYYLISKCCCEPKYWYLLDSKVSKNAFTRKRIY